MAGCDPAPHGCATWSQSGPRMSSRRRRKLRARPESARRGGGLRRLPELLGRLLEPSARRRGLAEARLLTDWPLVIGPALGARCQPVRLSGRTALQAACSRSMSAAPSRPSCSTARRSCSSGSTASSVTRRSPACVEQAPPARPVKRRGAAPDAASGGGRACGAGGAGRAVTPSDLRRALGTLGRTVKAQIPDPDDAGPS